MRSRGERRGEVCGDWFTTTDGGRRDSDEADWERRETWVPAAIHSEVSLSGGGSGGEVCGLGTGEDVVTW